MICRACLRARAGAVRAGASRPPVRQTAAVHAQPLSSITLTGTLPPRTLSKFSISLLPITAATSPRFYSATATAPAPAPPEKPAGLTEGESQVWDKVVAELAPVELQVQDVSGGCGSMYAIDVSSERFRGLNMLKQQRLVNSVLADMVKQWHGVQIRTRVPE